jgi:hypothetical protein
MTKTKQNNKKVYTLHLIAAMVKNNILYTWKLLRKYISSVVITKTWLNMKVNAYANSLIYPFCMYENVMF